MFNRELGIPNAADGAAIQSALQKSLWAARNGYVEVPEGSRGARLLKSWEELDEIRKTVSNQSGVVTGLGLVPYPLEAPAKLLYPVLTPLRNRFPRRVVGGTGVNYKKITGINTANVWGSVAEATSSTTGRNTPIKYNEVDVAESWKTYGMESFFTPEAQRGSSSTIVPGQAFNAEEFATLSCLQATMLAEEYLLLGGNVTALGKVTGIAKHATQAATTIGGLTPATNYFIYVTALTLQGYKANSAGQVAAVDAVGEAICDEVTIATTAGGNAGDESIAITWTAKRGALAYNVYISSVTGAANSKWYGRYTTNYALLLAEGSGGRLNAADQTGNALDFDGIIAIAEKAANNGYYLSLDNATLTGDNKLGVNEFTTAFKSFWDNYKVGPTAILCNSSQRNKISEIVLGSSAPIMRIEGTAGDQKVTAGMFVGDVLNPYMGELVPILTHPDLPPGTIVFLGERLGPNYPNANIGANVEEMLAWDYQREDFARVGRKTEFGVYASGSLVVRAPFTMGALVCVA